MATAGKLEAQITVPAGGWTASITDDVVSGEAVTIPAGTYYMSSVGDGTRSLIDEFEYQCNVPAGTTWTVSIAAGESATGKVTISCTGATLNVAWTDTDLRDALGFTGALSGSTSYTGSDQAEGLWLPGEPFHNLNGGASWRGWWESDQQHVENASGHVYSVMGRKKRITQIVWGAEARPKTWVSNESTTNESFEQFLIDGIYGEAPWGSSAGPVRFHPDADSDAVYGTYYAVGLGKWKPDQLKESWVHRWRIALPRLVEVPS